MTRETRVGTVVASSFLCLLGIVVASKWHADDKRGDSSEIQENVGLNGEGGAGDSSLKSVQAQQPSQESGPAGAPAVQPPEKLPTPIVQASLQQNAAPAKGNVGEEDPKKRHGAGNVGTTTDEANDPFKLPTPSGFPVSAAPIKSPLESPTLASDAEQRQKLKNLEAAKKSVDHPDGVAGPMAAAPQAAKNEDAMNNGPLSAEKKEVGGPLPIGTPSDNLAPAPLQSGAAPLPASPSIMPPPLPATPAPPGNHFPLKEEKKEPGSPLPPVAAMPPVPAGSQLLPAPPLVVPPPKKDEAPVPPLAGNPSPAGPPMPPIQPDLTPKTPAPPTFAPAMKAPAIAAPPSAPAPIPADPKPPVEAVKSNPPLVPAISPVIGTSPAPPLIGVSKDTPVLPTPMPIQHVGGPLPQPAIPAMPKVTTTQVKVEPDTCRPGENSFAALSQRFYGTDRYAAALQEFNRGQLNADPAVKQNPPLLQPGTHVVNPPKELLENHYADHLANAASPAARASSPPVVRISAPTPLTNPGSSPAPIGIPSPAAVRPAGPPSTDVTKSYRVPAQGLMILQIARDALGDGNRWPEIYRLNPSLQPQFPIPGGTELRLPASANVP